MVLSKSTEEFLRQYPGLKRYHVYRSDGPQRLVFIPKLVRRKKDLDQLEVFKYLEKTSACKSRI